MSPPRTKVRSGAGVGRRALLSWLLGAAAVVSLLVVAFLQLRTDAHPSSPGIARSPAVLPKPPSQQPREFDAYAGSASCRECHAPEFDSWHTSNHGLAERLADQSLDGRAFATTRAFRHGSQTTTVSSEAGRFTVRTTGPDSRPASYTPERVIGNDPLRQFLVPFPGGRFQALEASYDPARDEWFNVYGEEDRKPGEWGHWTGRGMNWNNMCAACHNVRVRKNYDVQADTYSTTLAERAVGCEACHGPMREHARWRAANRGFKGPRPDERKLSPDQVFATCASCHSRRSELTGDFAPGDLFDDHYSLAVVDATDTYYPDGQVHEEDYEYAAFLGSRMHAKGVRCTDCHEPHTAKVRLPGNLMCMSCHAGKEGVPVINPAEHGSHKLDPLYSSFNGGPDLSSLAARDRDSVAKMGGECVNCHMPQTFYMQRHRRHDHGFTVPDPLLTKEFGIPNACNRCHTDKDPDWAVAIVSERYGSKMDRPSRARTRAIAQARRAEDAGRDGLLALLTTDASDYWKASALGLLGPWAGEPAVAAAVIAATQHPAPLVRAHAAQALGPLASADIPEVQQALRPLLTDPARSVRFHAERALRGTLDQNSDAGREFAALLDYIADQPAGRLERAQYHMARGESAAALPELQKAVAWDPYSAPPRHDLAVALSSLGRTPEAVPELEAACGIAPKDAEYRYRLALVYHEVGRRDDAIASFRTAVALDPGHARAWYNLGLALDAAGSADDALAALSRAESAAPSDPTPAYAAATILLKLGRTDEARRAAERAVTIRPDFRPALELLSLLRAQTKSSGGGK